MSIPTIDETSNLRQVRCVVAGVNASGEPDLYFVKVRCTEDEYDNGDHYERAREAADDDGYETYLTYDEHDAGGRAMVSLCHDWDTAPVVRVGDADPIVEDELDLPAEAARYFYIHNINGMLQEFIEHKASILDLVMDAIAYEAKYAGITRVDITGREDNFWQDDKKVENTGIRTLIEFYADEVHPQGFIGRWTIEEGWS